MVPISLVTFYSSAKKNKNKNKKKERDALHFDVDPFFKRASPSLTNARIDSRGEKGLK